MFSSMLFHLVKKIEILFNSILFCPPNSSKSITIKLIKFCSWVAGNFMQVRKVNEATSDIHEDRQGADESYWTVFPVKFTEHF